MASGTALVSRLAYAEVLARRDTVPSLTRAAQLVHFASSSAYFERLTELDPEHSLPWLDAQLQANPRQTSARIARGLEEERTGSLASAESDLRQAAFFDRQYLPAWTLANFYFRRNRRADFWLWARRAADLTYDDYRPLLALAHAVEPDSQTAVRNLGASEKLLFADLDYLIQQNRLADAQQVARLLLPRKSPSAAPHLLALADRQLHAGRIQDALELTNAVRER